MNSQRWTLLPKPSDESVQSLQKQLGIDEVLVRLLVQRGITTYDSAKSFFRPSVTNLHSPFLMKDMEKATQRIFQAIENKELIMVYGDYDVDGTTSVALVSSYLKRFSDRIFTYIPDRYTEGYGVSYQGIDFAADNNIGLIIALDCGIKAIDKVAYAREKGIDFIICDHHLPAEELPKALAILNPKQSDCEYPYKELCGCGIGFKLIQALEEKQGRGLEEIGNYLEWVAIAIAADIVPMTGENRLMASLGLRLINKKPSQGVSALLGERKSKIKNITDLVFGIAPRINAAGRMKHGRFAVEILTEKDEGLAEFKAIAIENFNDQRKLLDEQITEEALQQIIKNQEQEKFTSVVFSPDWHKGVIGIVASRLIEVYYRPTLVFTKSGERLAASARSVKGFDVYKALQDCEEYIEQFGGHKYAAGLTLLPENYQKFKNRFEEVVSKTIDKQLLIPEITIDSELELRQITPSFFNILKQFAPFGPMNMNPTFLTRNLRDTGYAKTIGKNHEHIRFSVANPQTQQRFSCVGFGLAKKLELLKSEKPFDMVYHIEENHWQGNTTLQLRVLDIRPH